MLVTPSVDATILLNSSKERMVIMKVIGRVFAEIVCRAFLVGLVIPCLVLASEYVSVKSTSKKAEEQTTTSCSTNSFNVTQQEFLTGDNEEAIRGHYYQLAVLEENKGQHNQAAFHYALALDEEKKHAPQDTNIVNTNDGAIKRKSDFEKLFLTNDFVEDYLSIKSNSIAIKQQSNESSPSDASVQKTPNHSLSKRFLTSLEKDAQSAKIAVSLLMDDILAVTEAELDLRLTSYHQLIGILEEGLFSSPLDPGGLKGRWRSLWNNHAKAPENLISKNEIKKLLKREDHQFLDENHDIFSSFNSTYEVLTRYECDLCAYLSDHAVTIKNNFHLIKKHYQEFAGILIDLINAYNTAFDDNNTKKLLAYKEQIDACIEPKAILMSALRPGSWYRISQKKALTILGFNERGERGELKAAQNHHVSYMAPKSSDLSALHDSAGVYFKNDGQPSLQPGREAMVYHLYSLLKIPLAETGVVFIDNIDFQDTSINNNFFELGINSNPFCVQASGEIKGERADSFLKKHSYCDLKEMLDLTAYFWQGLGVLISYPSDGKTENFIVRKLATSQDKYELLSIDNDVVFETPIERDRINLKSLVLTLPQMEYTVSSSIKEHLAHLSPDILMLEWLSVLENTNEQYECLLNQLYEEKKRQNYRLDPDISKRKFEAFKRHLAMLWQDLSLPISLKKQELEGPLRALRAISACVCNDQKITLDSLLKAVEPLIGEAYEILRKKIKNPYDCIAALYGIETEAYLCLSESDKKKFDSLSGILGRTVGSR